jgi:FixJ family two-component response regulator
VDVLVTDLTMPAMTGVDLASILSEEQPDLPILFLSGHSDGVAESVAKGLPCADFLQKPFGEERLMAVLEALMMRRVQG